MSWGFDYRSSLIVQAWRYDSASAINAINVQSSKIGGKSGRSHLNPFHNPTSHSPGHLTTDYWGDDRQSCCSCCPPSKQPTNLSPPRRPFDNRSINQSMDGEDGERGRGGLSHIQRPSAWMIRQCDRHTLLVLTSCLTDRPILCCCLSLSVFLPIYTCSSASQNETALPLSVYYQPTYLTNDRLRTVSLSPSPVGGPNSQDPLLSLSPFCFSRNY
ncbi:uncharacterized protein BO66DRAFT_20125 [Aspergillus aculeatinus CBS 121060]|uniref:Uncharacterized protein n=1 Tax=Aspergillus aculeatinus CBS 121060 TaxID=1448322 RepID=A0ACD1HGS3_9EURO|nr:hypothetical protein BO66DRAFT_20125 [Aspergillus aculeatinus CBS 121060]RAH72775.1 hypothetical protein BO66DRAFT_20125 [Aspergillus aculeatinus CBS 121060]